MGRTISRDNRTTKSAALDPRGGGGESIQSTPTLRSRSVRIGLVVLGRTRSLAICVFDLTNPTKRIRGDTLQGDYATLLVEGQFSSSTSLAIMSSDPNTVDNQGSLTTVVDVSDQLCQRSVQNATRSNSSTATRSRSKSLSEPSPSMSPALAVSPSRTER